MRIAIIDNDKFFVMVMGGIVRMWEYELELFESCESVFKRHSEEKFDLLIMGLDSHFFRQTNCKHMEEINLKVVATTAIEVSEAERKICDDLGVEIIPKHLGHSRVKEILKEIRKKKVSEQEKKLEEQNQEPKRLKEELGNV